MRIALMAVFAGLMLSGCAAPAPTNGPGPGNGGGNLSIEEQRQRSLEAIDQRACRAMGGDVRQEGMLGMYRCVVPFADAGNVCRDSSDCLGQCRTSDDVTNYNAAPGSQVGACQVNDSPFGCYGTVENGTAQAMLCVD